MKLFYDMTFQLGELFVTLLTFTNYFYVGCPVMPLAVNVNERKFKSRKVSLRHSVITVETFLNKKCFFFLYPHLANLRTINKYLTVFVGIKRNRFGKFNLKQS